MVDHKVPPNTNYCFLKILGNLYNKNISNITAKVVVKQPIYLTDMTKNKLEWFKTL